MSADSCAWNVPIVMTIIRSTSRIRHDVDEISSLVSHWNSTADTQLLLQRLQTTTSTHQTELS
uniref:Uncharacterized protein n=1 Tax=Peronospora matthiolae TaxID=2874970 RepID=A0AAV1UNJ8_9STRA